MNSASSDGPGKLSVPRLDIAHVAQRAREIWEEVTRDLPGHEGLARASRNVAAAACEAERVARRLRRPLGLHRLPAAFLVFSLLLFAFWSYWHFFHVSELTIAISAREAVRLREAVGKRFRFTVVETEGSRASLDTLLRREAHFAFIQGGVEVPNDMLCKELGDRELVMFFLHSRVHDMTQIRTILTSTADQGSHSLARTFARIWGIAEEVRYVHDWLAFTDDPAYVIGQDVDAVFVVKDPLDEQIADVPRRLRDAGFQLASPDLGAMCLRLPYLKESEIRPGYLDPMTPIPEQPVASYDVATYLVGRSDLTARQRAAADDLLRQTSRTEPDVSEPGIDVAISLVQGLESVLGIVVYIGLTFLAFLGLDIVAYRRRFNELNTLVSLISMHQSRKDVIGLGPADREHNITYLRFCSDLLGLITVITGYYAQENSALTYNRLFTVINERCTGLKLNIQLKILHALIRQDPSSPEPPGPERAGNGATSK